MKQFAKFFKKNESSCVENRLVPITVSGVVEPKVQIANAGNQAEYKLVCDGDNEYLILSGSEVGDVLSLYCWKEVQIVGLLNKSNMTLIPQKVFPKGPDGESSNVIDLSVWKKQNLKRKLLSKVNELVVIPVAVLAILAL